MRLPQIILLPLIHLLISQNIIFAYKLLYYMKCNVFIIKLRQFVCGITFFLILNFSFDIKLGTQIIFLNDAIYLQWWNFVVFILQVSISVWSVRIDFYFSSNKLYLIFILGSQATSTFHWYIYTSIIWCKSCSCFTANKCEITDAMMDGIKQKTF